VTQMTEISLVEKSASFATLAFLPTAVNRTLLGRVSRCVRLSQRGGV